MLSSQEKMEAYRATAQQRQEETRRRLEQRRELAWEVAHQAAALLRAQFGAQRIVLFGSLARGEGFYSRSDVDLAAWGVDERAYYRAAGRLLALDPEFKIDLTRGEKAPDGLLAEIEEEGITYERPRRFCRCDRVSCIPGRLVTGQTARMRTPHLPVPVPEAAHGAR